MRLRILLRVLLVFAFAGLLAGCALNGAATYPVAIDGPYRLDAGDVVRVSVYGEEELTNSYIVDDRGDIALPLTGPIPVRGITTKVAASRIAAALANGFLRNPNVAVEVTQYRPFFIQGEVALPGKYPYVFGMTARAAIANAGGFKETANRDRVLIYRRVGDRMAKGSVDLDFPIYPDDSIVVQDRWF